MSTVTESNKTTLRANFDEFCRQNGLHTAILYVEDTPTEIEESLVNQRCRILPTPGISPATVDNAIIFISQHLAK